MKQIKQMLNLRHLRNLRIDPAMLALATVACGSTGGRVTTQEGSRTGQFEVSWTDSAGPALFAVPASGRFCAKDSLVELLGSRNDSAIGVVLLMGDSTISGLGPGSFSVMPARIFIPWRPRAIAALRMTGVDVIRQYESTAGQVTLTAASDSGLSGRVDLHLVASAGTDSLRVTGEFRKVRIARASFPCGRADKPAAGRFEP
jgi:hypothetical protein